MCELQTEKRKRPISFSGRWRNETSCVFWERLQQLVSDPFIQSINCMKQSPRKYLIHENISSHLIDLLNKNGIFTCNNVLLSYSPGGCWHILLPNTGLCVSSCLIVLFCRCFKLQVLRDAVFFNYKQKFKLSLLFILMPSNQLDIELRKKEFVQAILSFKLSR
ncbi:hypothetical protein GOODEAATRI_007259 [Goodea atripinnis]|uniref:Uncharacterized protein n=1 Tax=Goodea atripinnis TaxID=208336 RepID=A0ABV0NJ86_9TELE